MTRVTNIGRKRTYLEAGFDKTAPDVARVEDMPPEPASQSMDGNPLKKPRKRRKKTKAVAQDEGGGVNAEDVDAEAETSKQAKVGVKRQRKEKLDKASATELRRLKRIEEKQASTICLACRKRGHAVRECPEARTAEFEDEVGDSGTPGKSVVGVCYRCGSKRHNLSRCKKPLNPKNPLPFASCFVCSTKGHLASSCPKNQGKGIYPNGGACKICGQTSHLAKDCELKSKETASTSAMMLGSARTEGGADEDDFHVLKRRRDAVEKEDTILKKLGDKPLEELIPKPKPKVVVFR